MEIGYYALRLLAAGCNTNSDLKPLAAVCDTNFGLKPSTEYFITRGMLEDPCIEKLHYRNYTFGYEIGSTLGSTAYELNQYVTAQKNDVSRAKIMSVISWYGPTDLLGLLRNGTTVNEIYFPVWNDIINESILDEHIECRRRSVDELMEILGIL
ncbi:hypothetical protein C6P45_002963 [Maudiozyma exigua]|uniref:Uncharacterized protein n=1 Tax=Maudiozyma exigua TaxID=34358 RepID=A0A9P6WCG7_MAUEX|nr:hypothetical protein C6P45_002963 [Kazachstania exigua]